jgi:hypothetical protein
MVNQISELKRIKRELELLREKIIRANGSNSALSYIQRAEEELQQAIEEITGFKKSKFF